MYNIISSNNPLGANYQLTVTFLCGLYYIEHYSFKIKF